jgi:hypothetical protein
MNKVLISFTWYSRNVCEFVPLDVILNDMNGKDDFRGSFFNNGMEYQYKLHYKSGRVAIFEKGGVEEVHSSHSFNITFSWMYK